MSDEQPEATSTATKGKTKRGSGWLGVLLAPALLIVLGGVLGPMLCYPAYTLDGEPPYDDAMTRAAQCDAAIALIGTNVRGRVGMGCNGSYENAGGHGHLDWTVPVKGDSASGELYVNATLQGGHWKTNAARLSVGGKTVDLLDCK